jgi:hypothetical protein
MRDVFLHALRTGVATGRGAVKGSRRDADDLAHDAPMC